MSSSSRSIPPVRCTWGTAGAGPWATRIASLLEWSGHEVTREFYLNDAGVQIDRLAQSLWARVQEAVGRSAEIPEGGYHGEYLRGDAARLLEREGRDFADLPEEEGVRRCRVARGADAAGHPGCGPRDLRRPVRRDLVRAGHLRPGRHRRDAGAAPCARPHLRARRRPLAADHRSSATTRTGCSGRATAPTPTSCRISRITSTSTTAASTGSSTSGAPTTTGTSRGCRAAMRAARVSGRVLPRVHRAAGQGAARRRGGEDVEALGGVHHPPRPRRRNGTRRGPVLLPDAAGRLAAQLRPRSRHQPDRREPGLLRADGARPGERHLPGGGHRSRRGQRGGPAGRAACA